MSEMEVLATFLATCADDLEQVARAAGHGYAHLPLNVELNAGWTCLDNRENVRLSYDVNFLKQFSPDFGVKLAETIRRAVTSWEDPMGQWSAEQAEAARAQKHATLTLLAGLFDGHPRNPLRSDFE
jgi:hypothetical protein